MVLCQRQQDSGCFVSKLPKVAGRDSLIPWRDTTCIFSFELYAVFVTLITFLQVLTSFEVVKAL
jgi:hypothetical protein